MGGGNGAALPRLSKRYNAGTNSAEPQQEQLRDASAKDKHLSAQHHFYSHTLLQVSSDHGDQVSTDSIAPIPLCCIPAEKIPKGVLSLTKHDPFAIPSAASTETASTTRIGDVTNLQLALCPVEHNQHIENLIASKIGYSNPTTEGEFVDASKNGKRIAAHSLSYLEQISASDRCAVAYPCSSQTVPSREATSRTVQDRLRRVRISEGIKALRNSIPCSGTSDKGDEAAVLDDTIDYIKYLKLQSKVLSQSRLGCECTSYPFVHLEGYGHYLLHQKASNEPLEEVMGNLLELNPRIANELLESKGLAILPMDLAYALLQTV